MYSISIEQRNPDLHLNLQRALSDLRGFLAPFGVYIAQQASRRIRERPSYLPSVHPDPALSSTGIAVADVGPRSVSVGTSLPYARIQQEGGTITPKTVKLLAIPQKESLRALRGGSGATGWPRDIDPTRKRMRFVPVRNGSGAVGVLVDDKGELGHGAGILYVLVRKSEIKAQPYLYVSDADWALGAKLLSEHLLRRL